MAWVDQILNLLSGNMEASQAICRILVALDIHIMCWIASYMLLLNMEYNTELLNPLINQNVVTEDYM